MFDERKHKLSQNKYKRKMCYDCGKEGDEKLPKNLHKPFGCFFNGLLLYKLIIIYVQ